MATSVKAVMSSSHSAQSLGHCLGRFVLGVCLMWLPIFALSAQAQETPPPAYQLAADQAGVPSEVLYAVALTESGFKLNNTQVRPWPWTLNVAGESHYFKTKEDACSFLNEILKTTSAKRVDVGLGQVNYGYHRHRVGAACDLLDPYLNLEVAAQILKEQRRNSEEDWLLAIGRYHSPAGGDRARSYRGVVERHLIRVTGVTK